MKSMNEDELKLQMMASIDGELTPEEEKVLQARLKSDTDLMREYVQLKTMKTMTTQHQLKQPPAEFWVTFSLSTFTRIERGIGWILLTLGILLMGGYGGWLALESFYSAPDIELWVKIGVTLLGSGTLILLVSIIRERLYVNKNERYKEVEQ